MIKEDSSDGMATLIKFNYIFQNYSTRGIESVQYEIQYVTVNKESMKITCITLIEKEFEKLTLM